MKKVLVFDAEPTQIMTFGEMPASLDSDTMSNSLVIRRNLVIMVVSDDEDMIRRVYEGLK